MKSIKMLRDGFLDETNRLHSIYRKLNKMGYHSDYVKFLIAGRSRTGSNFLRGLLNSHSRIITFGEVFQTQNSMDWDHKGYFRSSKDKKLFQDEPVHFIKTRLFKFYPHNVSAVGFKIFYYHAQTGTWKSVWPYLQDQYEIRVLHMTRRNLLKTHLSRKRAALTERWVDTVGTSTAEQPVILDYQELLEDFIKTKSEEDNFNHAFVNHKMIKVTYEELSRDNYGVMKHIQEFLEVKYEDVKPATYKQSTLPLSAAIVNFHELKDRFYGTQWEEFFED